MNISSLPGRLCTAASAMVCTAFFSWVTPANAQTFRPAATPEQLLTSGNAKLVQNTGCGQSSNGANLLQVMTWDGNTPSFGWSYNGVAPSHQLLDAVRNGYTVSDPDIISYYSPQQGNHYMVATYLVQVGGGNAVGYEVQKYNSSTNSWSVHVPMSAVSSFNANCGSPNLDVHRTSGEVVFIFEEGQAIYARVLAINTNTLYPITTVDAAGPGTTTHREPDVTIHEAGTVSTTYITEDLTNNVIEVTLSQEQLPTVISGTGAFPTPLHSVGPYSGFPLPLLERPRIASPQPGTPKPDDCLTVVRYNPGTGDQIVCSWADAGIPTLPNQVVNNPLTTGLAGVTNTRPVVTYVGDGALVAWQYDDTNTGQLNSNIDVVGSWVYMDGTPLLTPNDLLVANQSTSGTQAVPSVEARNGLATWSSQTLVIWYDNSKTDIAYKSMVSWNAYAMRPGSSSSKPQASTKDKDVVRLEVYPNPATNGARIGMSLAGNEHAETLQVINPRTGLVVGTVPCANFGAGTSDVPLPALPSGLYLLRLQTTRGVWFTRFDYQP